MSDPDLPPDLVPPDPGYPPEPPGPPYRPSPFWELARWVTLAFAILAGAWFVANGLPILFFLILMAVSGGNVMGSNK
jgi:hypothetical protein